MDTHAATHAARARPADDAAAPARARRGARARPRHPRADLRAGPADGTRGEHHHDLPHARPARPHRPRPPHPPRPRRAHLLGPRARARPPRVPPVRRGHGAAHGAHGRPRRRAGRPPRLHAGRQPPRTLRDLRELSGRTHDPPRPPPPTTRCPPTTATRSPSSARWPARPPWSTAATAASSPSPARTASTGCTCCSPSTSARCPTAAPPRRSCSTARAACCTTWRVAQVGDVVYLDVEAAELRRAARLPAEDGLLVQGRAARRDGRAGGALARRPGGAGGARRARRAACPRARRPLDGRRVRAPHPRPAASPTSSCPARRRRSGGSASPARARAPRAPSRTRRCASRPCSPARASTPTTARSRTRSAGSAPPCTCRRAATAARRRSRGWPTWAGRRAGWCSCTSTRATSSCPSPGEPVTLEGRAVGRVGTVVQHHELGPVALALVKRSVPLDAELIAGADTPARIDPTSVRRRGDPRPRPGRPGAPARALTRRRSSIPVTRHVTQAVPRRTSAAAQGTVDGRTLMK